jgi:hypothetical protein
MTTIKVFEYKYEVACEDMASAHYYCQTYEEAYELFCELVGSGHSPLLKLNDKFNEQAYSRAAREALRKIINRTV